MFADEDVELCLCTSSNFRYRPNSVPATTDCELAVDGGQVSYKKLVAMFAGRYDEFVKIASSIISDFRPSQDRMSIHDFVQIIFDWGSASLNSQIIGQIAGLIDAKLPELDFKYGKPSLTLDAGTTNWCHLSNYSKSLNTQ